MRVVAFGTGRTTGSRYLRVMRRALDLGCETIGVGIRSICREEADLIAARPIQIVSGEAAARSTNWHRRIDALPERIYLTIDLDGFFGWHQTLSSLWPIWQAGHLAPIQAVGSPDESRSHFKAMELMERGLDRETGAASGMGTPLPPARPRST